MNISVQISNNHKGCIEPPHVISAGGTYRVWCLPGVRTECGLCRGCVPSVVSAGGTYRRRLNASFVIIEYQLAPIFTHPPPANTHKKVKFICDNSAWNLRQFASTLYIAMLFRSQYCQYSLYRCIIASFRHFGEVICYFNCLSVLAGAYSQSLYLRLNWIQPIVSLTTPLVHWIHGWV